MTKKLFNQYAKIRSILLLLLLGILFNIGFGCAFSEIRGGVLDTMLYYSPQKAYDIIASYGNEGRTAYIRGLLMLDYAYPLIYSMLLSFTLFRLSSNARISLVPFIIPVFDYLENTAIIVMLHQFPKTLQGLALVSGFFTAAKWLMVAMSIGLIVGFAVKKLNFKKKN